MFDAGCTWDADRCSVQTIDGGAIAARHEVSVDIDGDLNRRVPELIAHIRETLAVLNQLGRKGVTPMPDAA